MINSTPWMRQSQAVAWWPVHEFVAPLLTQIETWPMAGTPAWCDLPDDHPAKWAALLDAAQHHALRVEIAQEARRDAAESISAATDWPAIANATRERAEFCAANPWARRVIV